MENASITIVWFRLDLRLADNSALHAAAARGQVIPVYIWSPDDATDDWASGAASRVWLHHSLAALDRDLRAAGSQLIIRTGNPETVLAHVAAETGADSVFWNRRYEPHAIKRDSRVSKSLSSKGITCESFNGSLLREPWDVRKKDGTSYKVFTPFSKAYNDIMKEPQPTLPVPSIQSPKSLPASTQPADLQLLPLIPWDTGIRSHWKFGEQAAARRLRHTVDNIIETYETTRNLPAIDGVSQLSPHLHFGEISPRQVWNAVSEAAARLSGPRQTSVGVFLKEILWREFSHHLLYHFPHMPERPLDRKFENLPWSYDDAAFHAWAHGRTGYPIVDAGMRQLWHLGWMHNRVRMITGSFLVKDLLQPWTRGQQWFWDTLIDADLAQNSMNWQWVAGCGADASPFFRVFNPVLQGNKFDPDGDYVRQWIPVLAKLPNKYIHQPWEAPADVLKNAGVILGKNYPHPIINHATARDNALAAYRKLQK